jgi:hypothetical protein
MPRRDVDRRSGDDSPAPHRRPVQSTAPTIADFLPRAPDWRVDWDEMGEAFPWIAAMDGVPHDPQHHAEGTVDIHCRMVAEECASDPFFRSLPEDIAVVLYAAVLLHDVAKPTTTAVLPDGRVSSFGHSPRGAVDARIILSRMGWLSFEAREQVAHLVAHHQAPFHAMQKARRERQVHRLSQLVRCDLLSLSLSPTRAAGDARSRTGRRIPRNGGRPSTMSCCFARWRTRRDASIGRSSSRRITPDGYISSQGRPRPRARIRTMTERSRSP